MNRDTVSMNGSFEDVAAISVSPLPPSLPLTLSRTKCSPERFIRSIAFLSVYGKAGIETERGMSECEIMTRHIAARQLGQTLHKSLARDLLMPAVLRRHFVLPEAPGS